MKKSIITILIAALIISAAVFAKNEYSCKIPIGNRGIKAVVDYGDMDLLFIGSSTFRSNIDIRAIDDNYPEGAYILSYGGNQYVSSLVEYEELLERKTGSYSLMVLELDPLLLTEAVDLSDSRIIWDLSFKGKIELYNKMKAAGNADFSTTTEYFITSGMDDLITYPVTEPLYSTRYYKGAKTGTVASPGRDYLENESFDISSLEIVPAQEAAMLDLIKLMRDNRQPFVFIESPHYYRLSEDPVYKKYLEYMIELMDKNEVDYILASDTGFDEHNPDYFEDMSHMSTTGRNEYTKELIKQLKR